jgi:hypothetical protein
LSFRPVHKKSVQSTGRSAIAVERVPCRAIARDRATRQSIARTVEEATAGLTPKIERIERGGANLRRAPSRW